MSGSFENRYRKKALELLSPQKGESILEIGFGTGQSLIQIAKSVGVQGSVTAVDNSQSMYEITSKKIEKSFLQKSVKLICQDANTIELQQDSLDAVFMSFTLEIFNPLQISQLLNKLYISLKENGRICLLSMAESEKKTLIYNLYLWSHKRFPQFVDCRPINVSEILGKADFTVSNIRNLTYYGLPVDIVVGVKN